MSGENDDDLLTVDLGEGEGASTGKDPIEELKEQAAELQRKADEERAARERAERAAHDARRDAEQARGQIAETQIDAIGNAIAAEQAAIASAKRDLSTALAEGDYDKAADAQATLATATAKLVRLEGDKEEFEARKSAPQHQERRSTGDPAEDYIAQNIPPGRSQDWLRSHKECVTDPRLNARMLAAHHEAIADGIAPESDAYFAHIEGKLGFRKDGGEDTGRADPPPAQQRRTAPPAYAAPVSRDVPGARQTPNRITLTRAQAEIAESLGMTNAEYAKHLLSLKQEGKMT